MYDDSRRRPSSGSSPAPRTVRRRRAPVAWRPGLAVIALGVAVAWTVPGCGGGSSSAGDEGADGTASTSGPRERTGVVGRVRSAAERWAKSQLEAIAADLLEPTLEFEELQYEAPGTVRFFGVSLVAVDAGTDVAILTAERLDVELSEIPRPGKPVVIQSVGLIQPTVRLQTGADGQLVGWSNLIATSEDGGDPGTEREDGGSTKPSDVFAIRSLTVDELDLTWIDGSGEQAAIDGVGFELTNAADAEPGRYDLDVLVARPPQLECRVLGVLDLDDRQLDLDDLTLDLALSPETAGTLPPMVRAFLGDHEAQGTVELTARGSIPMQDLDAMALDVGITVADTYARFGKTAFPVERLTANAAIRDATVTVSSLTAQAFGGSVEGDALVRLRPELGWTVNAYGGDLALEALLPEPEDVENRLVGTMTVAGAVHGGAAAIAADGTALELSGRGMVQIREGRLVRLPVIGAINRTVRGLARLGPQPARDRLDANWQLGPGEARVRDLKIASSTVAARGEAEIGFDRRVEGRVNAGPLERVQDGLGALGDLFGSLTDSLVTYHVTGKLGDVKVTPKPFGLGATRPPDLKQVAPPAPPTDASTGGDEAAPSSAAPPAESSPSRPVPVGDDDDA